MAGNIERPKTLAGRIAKIAAEVGAIDKTGTNRQQQYKYIEYGEIATRIRRLQNDYGVAIFPKIESYTSDQVTNSKGGVGYHYLLNMVFTIVNADDQTDKQDMTWVGEATDWGDKGINKAATCGEKYFLMKLYHISEKDDDPDQTTPDQTVKDNPTRGATQQKQPNKINFKLLSDVRAKLPTISTEDELNRYWMSLKLPQREASLLKGDFAKRKKEIVGDEPEPEVPV